ncbi:hypothetical protein TNIN_240861 [Trichonephila inaurata madagascariensis]|uniref:Uncharacterized protein n=1 Tax=Trichonephila inaurata madagascariensis TaxID=2747483 RepID=A0A8X6IX38_9ARAC|nr:hypothetical protein TNIN_240861 [Trichonephila inaurata madagascariensis]
MSLLYGREDILKNIDYGFLCSHIRVAEVDVSCGVEKMIEFSLSVGKVQVLFHEVVVCLSGGQVPPERVPDDHEHRHDCQRAAYSNRHRLILSKGLGQPADSDKAAPLN